MVLFLARTRQLFNVARSVIGVLFLGTCMTWVALELGMARSTLKTVSLAVLTVYILVLGVLHYSKKFNVTGEVVKRIGPILLVANLSDWTSTGFNSWVSLTTILGLLYVLLFAYDRFKVINLLTHRLVVDSEKSFDYSGSPDDTEQEVEKNIIRAYVNTFKDKFKDNVVAYKVRTTRDADTLPVVTIDFAWEGSRGYYHLFEIQLKQS